MHLTLHLTTDCNMRCSYCYAPPRKAPPMTMEVAEHALRFAARQGSRSAGIVFFGGEPLLHPEIVRETVARARQITGEGGPHFHFKLTTNGLALDDAMLAFVVQEDVQLALSIDGTREAHDAHRRLPDGSSSFERTAGRLDALLAVLPYSSTITVVRPDTVRWLVSSVTWLLERGCRYLVVSLDYSAPWTDDDLVRLEGELERLGRRYLEWTRAGRKFYLSPFEVMIGSHVAGTEGRRDRCELAARQMSVDPGGWLFPCVQFTRAGPRSRWCIGHVTTGVDDDALARIRAEASQERRPCAGCAIRSRCNHDCGCLNWQSTGSIVEASPALCRYQQMLLPIADRIAEALYRERNPSFLHKHYNRAYPLLSLLDDQLCARDRGHEPAAGDEKTRER